MSSNSRLTRAENESVGDRLAWTGSLFLQSRCGPDWIESQIHSSLDGCEAARGGKAGDRIERVLDFQGCIGEIILI
jgi:hypothetical protein